MKTKDVDETIKVAVGYLRCSTDMQDDSIAQQRDAIDKWAKSHKFLVVEWFEDEGKSGTTFEKRPAFMRMVNRAEANPNFEYILVYDESRWGRAGNPRESTYWKVRLERSNVKVRIINSQSNSSNDIGSYVVEVVESAEASEYSKKLSRSTSRGCRDNAQKGYSNGGTAPYGYRRVAVDKNSGRITRELAPGKRRNKDEEKVRWKLGSGEEVRTVRRIFEMKVAGYGYRSIANRLNEEGIPCPMRGRWRNKNQMWSTVTIQSIVTNPSYCGDRIYNRHPLSKKHKRETSILGETKERWINPESKWVVARGAHEPIIDRGLFEKANPEPRALQRRNAHYYDSPYLLTGLVRCTRCGFNFQGQSYRASGHFYYVDGGNMNKGKSVCERTAIRRELLEDFVVEEVMSVIPSSDVVSRTEEFIERMLHGGHEKERIEATFDEQLKDIERKLQNLLEAVESGIGLETVLSRIKALEAKRRDIEGRRARASSVQSWPDPKLTAKEVVLFTRDFRKSFSSAPIEIRKELLRKVVVGVDVHPENRIARCTITRIPMVTPALRSVLVPSGFVGKNCSGDRT